MQLDRHAQTLNVQRVQLYTLIVLSASMSSPYPIEAPLLVPMQANIPENHRSQHGRVRNLRNNVQSIFIGRGHNASRAAGEGSNYENDARSRRTSEGPKTPRFTITMPSLPSTRLMIPNLRRSTSIANRGSQPNANSQVSSEATSTASSALPSPAITPSRPMSYESPRQPALARLPEPSDTRDNWRDRLGRRARGDRDVDVQPQAVGVGPEDQELANLASGRRPRRERRKRRLVHSGRSRSTSASPSQYRSQRKRQAVKSKIVGCVISGLFLTVLLSVCRLTFCRPYSFTKLYTDVLLLQDITAY